MSEAPEGFSVGAYSDVGSSELILSHDERGCEWERVYDWREDNSTAMLTALVDIAIEHRNVCPHRAPTVERL